MRILRRAERTFDDVSAAAGQVVETTEAASVALLAVAFVSLAALLLAYAALSRVDTHG